MPDLLLAADVGGTNTRLRLVDAADPVKALAEETYAEKKPVAQAVAAFLELIDDRRGELRAACFGVAGRVVDGDVRMTNRPEELITDERLSEALALPKERVRVVNDMEAHISGVEICETVTLRAGRPIGKVEGMVLPGTGLGVGYAIWHAGRRHAQASEGGHLDFAPPTSEHDLLLVWGRAQRAEVATDMEEAVAERISWEWFLSGPGLARIYAVYAEDLQHKPEAFRHVDPKDVTSAAFGGRSELDTDTAIRATRKLLELTGARAGNLCLDLLCTRGIWLGGNILNLLYDDNPQHFAATIIDDFNAVGPEALRETLLNVPLHLVRSADSGLRGAAVLAREVV